MPGFNDAFPNLSDDEVISATGEDYALAAKSDDELRAEVSTFAIDLKMMMRRIPHDDPSQGLIQAHLYLDHLVSLILTENVNHPRHLQLDRTGFAQKLQLVAALGLLSEKLIAPIKVVNSLRNKIAHNLEYAVSIVDETRLRSALPEGVAVEPDGSKKPLARLLQLLVVVVEHERQERAFGRLQGAKAMSRARIALDRFEGRAPRAPT